jgi:catechol 2,3-dioxygenase-like lactoylglutathione lyase family enzyme
MPLSKIEHANLRCANVERVKDFYLLLGLTVGPRPPFKSFGYWMYAGNDPIVHLVQKPEGEAANTIGTGSLDHVAFQASDLDGMRKTLRDNGIEFREQLVPRDNVVQVFVKDPEGFPLEMNFPAG